MIFMTIFNQKNKTIRKMDLKDFDFMLKKIFIIY